jgi:phosphatidate cytidylyltransferase
MISQQRLISTIVGWGIVFGVLILAPPDFFGLLIGIVSVLAFNEFLQMHRIKEYASFYYISLITFSLMCIGFLFPTMRESGLGFSLFPLAILALGLVTQKVEDGAFFRIAIVIAGLVYVGALANYFILVRFLTGGQLLVIVLALGTYGRDAGAFITGRSLRRGHVIMPNVSPQKTYEGVFGGLIFTIVIIALGVSWLGLDWTLLDILAIGTLMGVFGQVGDLVESWLKRSANVANSGRIIPGQGGLLDYFDSFIFTAPAMYLYITFRLAAA